MIKIALCDDESTVREGLLALLDQYQAKRGQKLIAEAFHSPLELLAKMERGTKFDVLLLDILMPGQNGIETAEEIRRFDSDIKIIFLTSSSEFAVQSYTVNAFYYQLKPFRAENFFPLLDSVFEACERERSNSFLLRCQDGLTRVEPKKIEFCEVNHRTLFIHLASGKILRCTCSLDKLESQLKSHGCFLRFHRSYLVNLDYVQNISYRVVTMFSQKEIPVPRGKYDLIKNAFLESAFQIGGGGILNDDGDPDFPFQ